MIAGPSCDGWRPLGPGRHCIGRSPTAELRLDDPTVELHHAVIDVGADGSIVFTQLTGRIASRLDGVPCETPQVVAAGRSLQVGASRLTFRVVESGRDVTTGGGSVVDADDDPWRRVVQRGPSPTPGCNVDGHRGPRPTSRPSGASLDRSRRRRRRGGRRGVDGGRAGPGDVRVLRGDRRRRIVRDLGGRSDRRAPGTASYGSAPSTPGRAVRRRAADGTFDADRRHRNGAPVDRRHGGDDRHCRVGTSSCGTVE